MSRIIVTGVSGSLGRRVAALLAAPTATGDREVREVREVHGVDLRRPDDLAPGVSFTQLDLAAPGSGPSGVLGPLMTGADSVVHLAWQTGDDPGSPAGAAEANREALARTLAAAHEGGVRQVVHLSSATVYGAWPDNRIPLTEDTLLRPNPGFAYAAGKAEAERVVSAWAARHPATSVAVLRPTVTLGSPERPLYQALSATRVPSAGDAVRPVQYLHVDDLASAVALVVTRSLHGVYNVAPDTGVEESTARALSGGVATFSLPGAVARPLASLGWDLWRRGVPPEVRPYTVHPWVVAPDRLKSEGWVPDYSSEEALVATDDRPHLDDLSPGRRQNLALAGTAVALTSAAGALGAVILRVRRRR